MRNVESNQGPFRVRLSLAPLLFADEPTTRAVPAETVATLSVTNPRPVAEAMQILSRRYGWRICYEDPPYVHTRDVLVATVRIW
jgi:hypothetical protein